MAGRATRATHALDLAGIEHRLLAYWVAEKVGEGYGEAVADAIGMLGSRVFKTLAAVVDGSHRLPSYRSIEDLNEEDGIRRRRKALRSGRCGDRRTVTGCVTGGISPFGQRTKPRLVIDSSAVELDMTAVSGGRRGIKLEMTPGALVDVIGGLIALKTDD